MPEREPRPRGVPKDVWDEFLIELDAYTEDYRRLLEEHFGVKKGGSTASGSRKAHAVIKHPCVLIRVNKLYRPDLPPIELYDATRSAWRMGSRRNEVKLALSVFGGVIREVYQINGWFPSGSTFLVRNNGRSKRRPGRHEFVGTIAPERIRKQYVNKFVGHLFTHGNQNPIRYLSPGMKRRALSEA